MPDKKERVVIETAKETYPFDLSIASEENAILPFHFDMDGILLRQANAQPVLRTVIKERITYVFMIPEGMDGAFRFEEAAEITGGKPFFTVKKGGAEVDVLAVSREEANQLFILRDGSLVLTNAVPLEDADGALRLETTQAENILRCYPADRLAGKAKRLSDEGIFGVYEVKTEEKQIPVACEPCAPCRWTISVPENILDGLKDARLQIDYQGDIGMLFLNDTMISDNFCNGATWEVGLMEHRDKLPGSMLLKITPIKEGANVNVESAMAARNEEVKKSIAELNQIRVQPVYEMTL